MLTDIIIHELMWTCGLLGKTLVMKISPDAAYVHCGEM